MQYYFLLGCFCVTYPAQSLFAWIMFVLCCFVTHRVISGLVLWTGVSVSLNTMESNWCWGFDLWISVTSVSWCYWFFNCLFEPAFTAGVSVLRSHCYTLTIAPRNEGNLDFQVCDGVTAIPHMCICTTSKQCDILFHIKWEFHLLIYAVFCT